MNHKLYKFIIYSQKPALHLSSSPYTFVNNAVAQVFEIPNCQRNPRLKNGKIVPWNGSFAHTRTKCLEGMALAGDV